MATRQIATLAAALAMARETLRDESRYKASIKENEVASWKPTEPALWS